MVDYGWKGNVELSAAAAVIVPVAISVAATVVAISVAAAVVAISVAAIVAAAVSIAAIVAAAISIAAAFSYITVRRAEDWTEAAAGTGFCCWRKEIQREADIFKCGTRIANGCCGGAAFRYASAQRIYYHIYSAEQLYNGEQTDGYIDSDGSAQSCIAIMLSCVAGITSAAASAIAAARAAGRMPQFCCKSHRFAFCNDEGSAVGSAVAELVCHSGDIGFGGAEQCYPQVIHICGINTADEAAIRQ